MKKDKNFCLAINGVWGSGKTFVLDMIAEKLNISRASLGGLISRNKMGVDKLEEIATALNCDLKITFIDKETHKEY